MTYNRNNIARGLAYGSYDPINRLIQEEEWEKKEERLREREEKNKRLSVERRLELMSQFGNRGVANAGYVTESKSN